MSATYNWAYRPGVTNKYGFTIPAGADNLRPTGWCYVALFGNDNTGNGSRQYPYRTITKAVGLNTGLNIVLGSGVYRETAIIASNTTNNHTLIFIGDGDVIIDISYNGYLFSDNVFGMDIYNIQFRGNGTSCITNSAFIDNNAIIDVFFNGSWIANTTNTNAQIKNCIISGYNGVLAIGNNGDKPNTVTNCTFIFCNNFQLLQNVNIGTTLPTGCIFYNCNISATSMLNLAAMRYTLFFQCNFKLTTGIGNGGVLYPLTPSGYTYYSSISALQAAYFAAFSTASFTGCTIADPLFNNLQIGDYSLSFSSPAKNLSYFGTYVGAESIALPIKASATESIGNFDFSTNVNLSITEDSIILIDPTQNAEIKTKLIVNTSGRQISKLPIYGFNADRNGQYIDSIADLDGSVKNTGDTLSIPASYLIENGAITYNSSIYQVGDRLTTVSGQTTFTTSAGGVLREILEAPERHTVMARFSDGGLNINAGDALVVNYWYYVITGSITYDTVLYTAGQGFKAVDTTAFSGTGNVIVALSNENFQHYEPGIQPTSNNAGDTRTGVIIRGNGDPAYVRGGYGVKEFPINAKFIQLYYIINVSNLKS